jgi:hypothetical protein
MTAASVGRQPSRSPTQAAPVRDWLAEIQTIAKPKPTAAVIYGPPGVGKSSLGAAAPSPIFLIDSQEDGINTLKASGLAPSGLPVLPPAKTWSDALGMLDALASGEHPHRTLVVDALGGFERLCHEEVCRRDFKGDWGDKGFSSYHKGYEVALADWRQFLFALDRLRSEKGMAVICLAHSVVKAFKNPEGEDYDRFIPDMHHKTWGVTHKWADMVLFCNYYVEAKKDGARVKGRGGQDRFMYTEYHAAFEAKNRHALPPEISMGTSGAEAWANLRDAISQARKGA